LLARQEPFAGEEWPAAFEAEGITVMTGARRTAARRGGKGGPVVASVAHGREFTGDEIRTGPACRASPMRQERASRWGVVRTLNAKCAAQLVSGIPRLRVFPRSG